ncbi:hypothetical protein L227DRAFT_577072 [Lentinus tigrinus ALCF2SS1-6]|uniref:Uncharacterized protein n=1 Tax=Lentinus tigrinus ALCF2SS1-6 TaxID=1328759 RepID=A0A5C2S487_9APHY|nr:hypothetical protein L227DRAFT_577072 [Lentinus tigrinus ALCF2SS1-6]
MPVEVASASGASTRSKPTTRSSIRQSFGLSSVGKAIADVMHKDSKENEKDREKATKKKDTAARRTSAILAPPARASTDKAPTKKKDIEDSPDAKTITRHSRRQSALRKLTSPSDDHPSPSDNTSPKGSSSVRVSVRNRNSLAGSGLPKYRPRSLLGEPAIVPPKKSPTPTQQSRRRRLSSSDDETDEVKTPKELDTLDVPSADKSGRPISPLPHRAALKVNLTSAINVRPVTPEKKDKGLPQPKGSPSSVRTTSTKASKMSKTSTPPVSGSGSARSALPRPPSSASSSVSGSSRTPGTPGTPTMLGNIVKGPNMLRLKNAADGSPSPLRNGLPAPQDSPLGRVSARKNGSSSKSGIIHMRGASVPATPTPKSISADSSMDSMDADDVEFMLGSIVSPTAPTPAIPRIVRSKGDSSPGDPQTPTRSPFLPSRAQLSYASPAPPSSTESSPFLRPKPRHPGNDRGSILSWEQLAQHSKTLDDEDVERMISEIPAPFRPGAISPALSVIDIPDSPSLSALPSPTGYGSISQVLLPDVTPSPAIHNTTRLFDNMGPPTPSGDSAALTLLRLQLAAAESRAQERLAQMQSLEEQLHAAKEARMRDAEELARQISELEQQVHGNLAIEGQRTEQIAVLEEMLREAQAAQEKSVKDVARKAEDALCASKAAALQAKQAQARSEVAFAAREVGAAWFCVRETAESELELVRSNREMLAVLLAGLDHNLAQLSRK